MTESCRGTGCKAQRSIIPEDPALYDFALFGLGVTKELE